MRVESKFFIVCTCLQDMSISAGDYTQQIPWNPNLGVEGKQETCLQPSRCLTRVWTTVMNRAQFEKVRKVNCKILPTRLADICEWQEKTKAFLCFNTKGIRSGSKRKTKNWQENKLRWFDQMSYTIESPKKFDPASRTLCMYSDTDACFEVFAVKRNQCCFYVCRKLNPWLQYKQTEKPEKNWCFPCVLQVLHLSNILTSNGVPSDQHRKNLLKLPVVIVGSQWNSFLFWLWKETLAAALGEGTNSGAKEKTTQRNTVGQGGTMWFDPGWPCLSGGPNGRRVSSQYLIVNLDALGRPARIMFCSNILGLHMQANWPIVEMSLLTNCTQSVRVLWTGSRAQRRHRAL